MLSGPFSASSSSAPSSFSPSSVRVMFCRYRYLWETAELDCFLSHKLMPLLNRSTCISVSPSPHPLLSASSPATAEATVASTEVRSEALPSSFASTSSSFSFSSSSQSPVSSPASSPSSSVATFFFRGERMSAWFASLILWLLFLFGSRLSLHRCFPWSLIPLFAILRLTPMVLCLLLLGFFVFLFPSAILYISSSDSSRSSSSSHFKFDFANSKSDLSSSASSPGSCSRFSFFQILPFRRLHFGGVLYQGHIFRVGQSVYMFEHTGRAFRNMYLINFNGRPQLGEIEDIWAEVEEDNEAWNESEGILQSEKKEQKGDEVQGRRKEEQEVKIIPAAMKQTCRLKIRRRRTKKMKKPTAGEGHGE